MSRIYRHIFVVLALSLVAASCQKNTDVTGSGEVNAPINVKVMVDQPKSVVESTLTTLQINGFRMAAVKDETTQYLQQHITYDGSFKLTASTNWPSEGSLKFYAVYPETVMTTSPTVSFDYVSDAMSDVIVASTDAMYYTDGDVSLNFTHALSQIKVSCKCNTSLYTFKVTSISVSMPGRGTYDFTSGTWSTSETKNSTIFTSSWGQTIGTTDYMALGETISAFPAEGVLTVAWKLYNGDVLLGDRSCSVSITPEMGKVNNYQCTLSGTGGGGVDEITFRAEVSNWGAVDKLWEPTE